MDTNVKKNLLQSLSIYLNQVRLSHKIAYGIIGLGLLVGLLLLGPAWLIIDEVVHMEQIQSIFYGKYVLHKGLTVPPTYHAMIALIAKALHLDIESHLAVRILSFLGSIGCIFIFHSIAQRLSADDCHIRTLQFIFFPLIFPFFFLIYTDIWALGSILLSVERALARKLWTSALAIVFATLLRPPNIVFSSLPILLFFSEFPMQPGIMFLRNILKKLFPFFLLGAGFIIFVIMNGGIAIGDRKHHQIALNFSNLWLFFLLFAGLLLPACCLALKNLISLYSGFSLQKLGFVSLLFLFYYLTYTVSHPYNFDHFFLRNMILYYTTHFIPIKILAFFIILLGGIGFFFTKIHHTAFKIFLPIICLLYILPFPLIEGRYYIPAFSLFLLFRKEAAGAHEIANIILYILCSLALLFCASKYICFL